MKIGSTNFDGPQRKEWFTIEANTDNLYRVLPPLFSMADRGQYAKYYATHSIWVKDPSKEGSKARPYKFQCIQVVDKETKEVKRQCPFCQEHSKNRGQYDLAKQQNVDSEQLKSFLFNKVLPFAVEKKFYVNAVNLDNKVGVLPLGIKCFRSLQDRLNEVRNNYGVDATGIDGLFFNFRKIQKFKGDRDTAYQVDTAQEVFNNNGQMMTKLKNHVMTEEFIQYLENSARDLGTMFREIEPSEVKALAEVSDEGRWNLVQRIFGKSEKAQMEVSIPNTNATAVASMNVSAEGINLTVPSVQPAAAPVPEALTPQTAAPVAQPAAAPVAQPATAPSHQTISDEDFINTFGGGS